MDTFAASSIPRVRRSDADEQYPYLPPHVSYPKECKKLYLVTLPKSSQSMVRSQEVARNADPCRGIRCTVQHETPRCPSIRVLRQCIPIRAPVCWSPLPLEQVRVNVWLLCCFCPENYADPVKGTGFPTTTMSSIATILWTVLFSRVHLRFRLSRTRWTFCASRKSTIRRSWLAYSINFYPLRRIKIASVPI
jgi:hypothetical protein